MSGEISLSNKACMVGENEITKAISVSSPRASSSVLTLTRWTVFSLAVNSRHLPGPSKHAGKVPFALWTMTQSGCSKVGLRFYQDLRYLIGYGQDAARRPRDMGMVCKGGARHDNLAPREFCNEMVRRGGQINDVCSPTNSTMMWRFFGQFLVPRLAGIISIK